ncbi:hypothetical protein [Kribbella sp.]|uniref:WXG100 family type VII secretion target n=1 Tax=Kribbella sp. TaxID=1871183 RepID=UPI002D2F28F0|nr:hypothetical protein [Kribbella sp.]HZX06369.1 hypothetical protein [Kribbella sp.]
MLINYPYNQMGQGAVDMAGANKAVTDLTDQFEQAMTNMFHAWDSPEGAAEFQSLRTLWRAATVEVNARLDKRAQAMDEAQIGMQRADQRAANAARDC